MTRKRDLLCCLIAAAVLGYYLYTPLPPTTPLSIEGITLGMTREQVESHYYLYKPIEEGGDVYYELSMGDSLLPHHPLYIHYWRDTVWAVKGDQVEWKGHRANSLNALQNSLGKPSWEIEVPADSLPSGIGYRYEPQRLTVDVNFTPRFILEPTCRYQRSQLPHRE